MPPHDATTGGADAATPRVRVGCAGWSIDARNRSLFGDGASMLARYATLFDAVEINSSFYRPHQRKTYARWAESVPADFRFSVKVPKTITHELALHRPAPLLDRFIDEATGLGDKLGGLLVQLPPSLAFDARVAATFFAMLRGRWRGSVACEPRHRSWFDARATALLERQAVTRVAADPAPVAGAEHVAGAGAWRYWRWHGSPRMYYSAYSDDTLRALTDAVRAQTPHDAEAWIVFDNTAHGHAVPDAARLRGMLATRSGR